VKLLIDGDVLAYRAGFATEKTKYLVSVTGVGTAEYDDANAAKSHIAQSGGGTLWSRKELEPEEKALMLVDVMIGDIRARYSASTADLAIYLTGVGNFRNSVATRATYKGNRSGAPVPTHFKAIRDHLVTRWGAVLSAGEEADDLIGIAATANPGAVICSIDKDLMQLPGKHYNFVTKEEVVVTPKQAVLNFYAQVLSGDPVDNVPGLPGIGPVKARKALEDAKSPLECWNICMDMYAETFNDLGLYALETARLVYVRRKVNETWEPPTVETKKAEALGKPQSGRKGRVSKRAGSSDSKGPDSTGDQV
jgi:5'-3' exonuclease, N-terminal resolvase-like domain